MKRVMVGMSGGVDSSVTALLLKQQGYEVVGVTFRLFSESDLKLNGESRCCSLDDVNDARFVCDAIGIPHYVFNMKELFRQTVVEDFVKKYTLGMTPNPCIACNRYIKFDAFLQKAKSMDFDYIATGHYSRIEKDEKGVYSLKRSANLQKDQSYVLYNMTQDILAHTLMPLGAYTKDEVRKIAEENNLVVSKKPDSQDICFVPDGDYSRFIENYTGKKPVKGDFIDVNGKVLGTHCGIQNYTIGQRKGLGISLGKPAFVVDIKPDTNQVVLGDENCIFTTELTADDVNIISGEPLTKPFECLAKIRYAHKEEKATVAPAENGRVRVTFEKPQRAVTKGQAVVFYNADTVLGGGTIV